MSTTAGKKRVVPPSTTIIMPAPKQQIRKGVGVVAKAAPAAQTRKIVKIQALVRGYFCRKKYKRLRKYNPLLNEILIVESEAKVP